MTIQDCLEFLSTSYSPFHAVDNVKKRLLSANFQQLSEGGADWQLQAGKSYFVTRNQTSVIAFKIGSGFQINKDKCGSLGIVVAHTDSPCLKVKPRSRKVASGYGLVGVQTYGGGLWHTWFDRDLSMSGRIVVKSGADEKLLESRLVSFGNDAIMRIPTLAIHLDRTVKESFKFNDESQLQPILLNRVLQQTDGGKVNSDDSGSDISKSHHEALLSLITEKLQLKSMDQIVDFELCLHDTVPARLGGLKNEFIFSPRLDNLMMSYCAVEALLNSAGGDQLNECGISMVTLFDNEEVGSDSAYGANSNFLPSVLDRIISSFASSKDSSSVGSVESALSRCMASSLLISADMAHAIHPNYADKHEQNHQPVMNEGVTIKINANQRYATTSIGSSILKQIAQDYNKKIASNGGNNNNKPLKLQEFVVRNDSPCGSTIGPILSTKMGIQTVDVGNAMLSMHSIRECCGAEDVQQAINLFTQVFKHGQQSGGYQVQNALN